MPTPPLWQLMEEAFGELTEVETDLKTMAKDLDDHLAVIDKNFKATLEIARVEPGDTLARRAALSRALKGIAERITEAEKLGGYARQCLRIAHSLAHDELARRRTWGPTLNV